MRAQGATFWLLNGDLSWRTGLAREVAVGADIRLAADRAGPLALRSGDGSLGGLRLPRGMAFDASRRLYLLDVPRQRIRRFDADRGRFEDLPGVGGVGPQLRQFGEACAIAIAGEDLYVIERGNRRVQVFALSSLALRHVWGPRNAAGAHVAADDLEAWQPHDIAACDSRVLILDRRSGAVLLHRPGRDGLRTLIAGAVPNADRFSDIAIDTARRVYLLDHARERLSIFGPQGHYQREIADPGEVTSAFAPAQLRLDHHGRFCLPASLARNCNRELGEPPDARDVLATCRRAGGGLLFDRSGNSLPSGNEPELAGPPLYVRNGVWYSEALDSQLHACQWHRIELALAALPAGTKLVVSTYTDRELRGLDDITNPALLPERLWETRHVILGRADPGQAATSADTETWSAGVAREELLVQSHPGQYLWLRLELFGDGYVTPRVQATRVHYPRDSYLKHLPAVYGADVESRWFLERFLALFKTEWDAIEARVASIERYFDPAAVPDGPWLDYLAAQWLALPLEGSWSYAQKRRLLSMAPGLYQRRGTVEGLRSYIRAHLVNLTGIEQLLETRAEPGPQQFPLLLEGFRRRNCLMLGAAGLPGAAAPLGRQRSLWSPAVVGRLQLDSFAQEGQVRLISTGDPERDVFHEHAHRFQVVVPSAWVRTRAEEELLLRAIDAEKPVHAQYQLCLVEPRLRVGIQSTVGVDTILGPEPYAVLASAELSDVPVNRPPRQRLGYDTVLACKREPRSGLALNPTARVGTHTAPL